MKDSMLRYYSRLLTLGLEYGIYISLPTGMVGPLQRDIIDTGIDATALYVVLYDNKHMPIDPFDLAILQIVLEADMRGLARLYISRKYEITDDQYQNIKEYIEVYGSPR